MVVLVTGASGQLGQALQSIANDYQEVAFCFFNSSELDITDLEQCKTIFKKVKPNFCINAAAYTAVDKAEIEHEIAFAVNVTGAKNLAKVCKENNTVLLHISTDFVFDGNASKPYSEDDIPNPTSVYGQTKLDGERAIQEIWEEHFIIRTSWVYSNFGNNFMKTMLRLSGERDAISVVNDQIGTPTNAVDLAKVLLKIIISRHVECVSASHYGVYNFSNEGQCSWYDFARKIFEINAIKIDLQLSSTINFPTAAKRPKFSVLDKSKIKEVFGIEIKDWEDRIEKTSIKKLS